MSYLRAALVRADPFMLVATVPTVVSLRFFTPPRSAAREGCGLFVLSRWLSNITVPQLKTTPSEVSLVEEDEDLTPKEIVEQLDRFIIGQQEAKRAVAIALRNRWRRHRIAAPLSAEIIPKNILMMGPTGCGKTEIARRLAKLASAPFVKVEATKFTEVGFHGRDVDQIIRDLVDNAVMLMRQNLRIKMMKEIERAVEDRILEKLVGPQEEGSREKESFRRLLRKGDCDDEEIELDPGTQPNKVAMDGPFGNESFPGIFVKVDKVLSMTKNEKRKVKVSEAKSLLEEQELERLVPQETIQKEAIRSVEQDGIVFIDEIDKIVVNSMNHHGADASSEGRPSNNDLLIISFFRRTKRSVTHH